MQKNHVTPDLAVHGLGYVGLTAAVHFAKAGVPVLGYDPDPIVVQAINAGRPRAGEFLSYLDVNVKTHIDVGLLRATNHFDEIVRCRTHIIAVPTERAGHPYDGIVDLVLENLIKCRFPIDVLVESTLTPGTIDRLLERCPWLRTTLGVDVFLAVCPRRDWFADPQKNLATLPRVVGGVTPKCTQRAVEILGAVSPYILTTDYRTAELTKALENALLHVPVVFLHQLACALPNHNVAEAIRLVSTHWRFESLGPLYIGFGTGGRCVPLGTAYLMAMAQAAGPAYPYPLTLGEQALEWDEVYLPEAMSRAVLHPGVRTAIVLGIAYRPNFRDAGRSPGLRVAKKLSASGVFAVVHDPMWSVSELEQLTGLPVMARMPGGGPESSLAPFDAVLLATPHPAYRDLPLMVDVWRPGQRVLDASGMWAGYRAQLQAREVRYRQVGEPGWSEP